MIDQRLEAICGSLYRVSAKVIIIVENRLLLTHESEGWYSLPGGGIDYGETPDEAIQRELDEELGLAPGTVSIDPKVAFVGSTGIVKQIPRLVLYYHGSAAPEDLANIRGNELEHRWVTREELQSENLSPGIESERGFLLSQLS